MLESAPLLITVLSAAIGAAILAYVFQRNRQGLALGAALGALGGVIGPQLFMVPLEYCSLNPENHDFTTLYLFNQPIEVNVVLVITALLIGIGIGGMLALVTWLTRLVRSGRVGFLTADATPGAFRGRWLMPWLLLSPTLIVLVLFSYYPTLQTFGLSTLLARLGAPRTVPVCLNNFAELFTSSDYYLFSTITERRTEAEQFVLFWANSPYLNSLGISLFMTFFIVIFSLSIALLIAIMAYQPIKGGSIYRILLVWPYAISPVVAGIIFQFLFNPITGLINYTLRSVGLENVPWLLDPNIAPWTVIAASVWNILGFNILFYIAGLQNVPTDLQEAAAIDGANVFQRFWRITLPMLSPITFFLIITNVTYAFFDTFGVIDYLTTGGPVNATSNLIYEIFVVGVQQRDLGRAAAQSILLLMIVIAITVFQFRTSGRRVNYGV